MNEFRSTPQQTSTVTAMLRERDREILHLAIPAFGSLVAGPLYVLADTAIVGHIGRDALAALGVASAILLPAYAIFNFLAYNTTGAVARSRGAGNDAAAAAHGLAGLWLSVAIGITVLVLGIASAEPITNAISPNSEVASLALTYLRISFCGAPMFMIALAATGYLRGAEDTKTPLFIAIGANITNIVLELVFVYKFDWGIAGSAWGTVIAQTIAACAFLIITNAHFQRADVTLRPHWQSIKTTARVGVHLMLRTGSLITAFFVASVLAARLGATQIAAHQIAEQIWVFLAFALDAIAIAGQVIVGRTLGAGDHAATRKATATMLRWGWWSGCICAVLIIGLHQWLPKLFTNDIAIRQEVGQLLWIVAAMQPIGAIVYVLDGILIGAGDVRYLARAMAWASAVFLAAAASVVMLGGNLVALWFALFAFVIARFGGMVHRYRGPTWLVLGQTPP